MAAPSHLHILREGLKVVPIDSVVRTAMDSGRTRARRRSRARIYRVELTWRLDAAGYGEYLEWLDSEAGAGGGALAWDTLLPLGDSGVLFTPVTALFLEQPGASSRPGGRWDVSAVLEVVRRA